MSGFDIEGIQAEQADGRAQQARAVQHARGLLTDYVATAGKLGLQPRTVDPASPAARGAGIALAKWPLSSGKLVYFPLVINAGYAQILWLGGESQGLSVTPSGQFFFAGKPTTVDEAAVWLARACGYNENSITACLTEALKGSPASFG